MVLPLSFACPVRACCIRRGSWLQKVLQRQAFFAPEQGLQDFLGNESQKLFLQVWVFRLLREALQGEGLESLLFRAMLRELRPETSAGGTRRLSGRLV